MYATFDNAFGDFSKVFIFRNDPLVKIYGVLICPKSTKNREIPEYKYIQKLVCLRQFIGHHTLRVTKNTTIIKSLLRFCKQFNNLTCLFINRISLRQGYTTVQDFAFSINSPFVGFLLNSVMQAVENMFDAVLRINQSSNS